MFQTQLFKGSARLLSGGEIEDVPFTVDFGVEGRYDPIDGGVMRPAELTALVAPWMDLFTRSVMDRFIARPSPAHLALFLATHTNWVVDTYEIKALVIRVWFLHGQEFSFDSRTPTDLKQATQGGPWRGHTPDSLVALSLQRPDIFSPEVAADIQRDLRKAKVASNDVIARYRARRLSHLREGGGSIVSVADSTGSPGG